MNLFYIVALLLLGRILLSTRLHTLLRPVQAKSQRFAPLLGVCRSCGVDSEIGPSEVIFCGICRPIAQLWAKKMVKMDGCDPFAADDSQVQQTPKGDHR